MKRVTRRYPYPMTHPLSYTSIEPTGGRTGVVLQRKTKEQTPCQGEVPVDEVLGSDV